MNRYTCPVCGYSELEEPPRDPITNCANFDICPCCGCEFGYNDATLAALQNHRSKWIKNGAKWFDPNLKPANWNLRKQLANVGVNLDEYKA
jgi:hypothetical protein